MHPNQRPTSPEIDTTTPVTAGEFIGYIGALETVIASTPPSEATPTFVLEDRVTALRAMTDYLHGILETGSATLQSPQDVTNALRSRRGHFAGLPQLSGKVMALDEVLATLEAADAYEVRATFQHARELIAAEQAEQKTAEEAESEDPGVEAARKMLEKITVSSTLQHPPKGRDTQHSGHTSTNHNTQPNAELIDEMIQAAGETAIIDLGVPSGTRLQLHGGQQGSGRGGFQVFGNGANGFNERKDQRPKHFASRIQYGGNVTSGNVIVNPDGTIADHVAEAYSILPVDEAGTEYEFAYVFAPAHLAAASKVQDYPEYREPQGLRNDGKLITSIRLSPDKAKKLETAIKGNPELVRQLAEQIVLQLGLEKSAENAAVWKNGIPERNINRLRPPYEGLPEGHRIHKVEWGHDPKQNRQALVARPLAAV